MLKNVKIIKIGLCLRGPIECQGFYYIIRLRVMGENSKIEYFQVFQFEMYFYFHNNISS